MSAEPVPLPAVRSDDRLLATALEALGHAQAEACLPVLAAGGRSRRRGAALVEAGLIDDQQLAQAFAEVAGLDFIDLAQTSIDIGAAGLIPRESARRYEALPIGFDADGALRVAVADPADRVAAGEIAMTTGTTVRRVVTSRSALDAALARLEGLDTGALEEPEPEPDPSEPEVTSEDAPVVRLVHSVIADALEQRASDVHVEHDEHELRVKLRIDGVLVTTATLPAAMAPAVVSRIKILADLDISERRLPQDGRIRTRVGARTADLRVVTVPVVGGEAVVLRLLDQGGTPPELTALGLEGEALATVLDALDEAHGAILVTGPTGSGKTTTLYGALQRLNGGDRSIITVEDPVEYRIANAKQVQLNARAGLTFATALRTLVRADPDVVMVGEVRDAETARIAIEAALTGHLVLSTLHTNGAAGAPVRLIEMGIEPFLVASAVRCVVAQRLVRRLCHACRTPVALDLAALHGAGLPADAPLEAYAPTGCAACSGTGFRGRVGVFEVLRLGGPLRRLVLDGVDAETLHEAAVAEGLRDLRTDALHRVADGSTSLQEVTRVLGRGRA